jgi:hypothetical protein
MASTYTTNLGIEKIATGEQSGTWGSTTNTNLDLIDQAVNGIVQITVAATGSTGSPNALTITNGSASDGRNKFIDFYSPTDLGGTVYYQLDPNDAEKIAFVRNSLGGGQTLVLFQGTYNASNDVEVPNGVDMLVKFDGTGASATVTNVFEKLQVNALSVNDGNITNVGDIALDSISADGTDINVSVSDNSATALTVKEGANTYLTIDTTDSAEKVLVSKTLDVGDNNITNVGNIALDSISADGTQIDIDITDNTASAFTISEGANNYIEITTTDGSELITVSKNSTFAGTTIADLGVVTTVDINGGTIDGVTIGGASAGAGTFTTLNTTGAVVFNEAGADVDFRVEGDTDANLLFVDASADAVGIGTTAPILGKLHVLASGTSDASMENVAHFGKNSTSRAGLQISANATEVDVGLQAQVGAGNIDLTLSSLAAGTNIERMRIDTSGNVGIGTSSPVTALTLGTGTTGVCFRSNLATLNSGKIAVLKPVEAGTGNGHLVFETYEGGSGGGERMRITSAGNVGIGTTAPDYQLHVTTTFAVGASGFNQQLSFTNDTIQSLLLGTGYTTLKLNPLGGSVNIGGTNGAAKFEVNNAVSTTGSLTDSTINLATTAVTGRKVNIGFGIAGGVGNTNAATIGFDVINGAGALQGDLFFSTRGSTADSVPTERLRITSSRQRRHWDDESSWESRNCRPRIRNFYAG